MAETEHGWFAFVVSGHVPVFGGLLAARARRLLQSESAFAGRSLGDEKLARLREPRKSLWRLPRRPVPDLGRGVGARAHVSYARQGYLADSLRVVLAGFSDGNGRCSPARVTGQGEGGRG